MDSITLRFASKQKSGPVHFGGLKQQLTDISQSISRKFTDKGVLLMQAALDGDTVRVIKYLENNKRLYIKDHQGNSLLHLAALSGNVETAAYLMNQFLSIKSANLDGFTPVDFANATGCKEMQRLFQREGQRLIEAGEQPPRYRS